MRSGVSAAILAGGRARRLGGADKASLQIGGSRIIDRQLAVLRAIADDVLLVGADPSRYQAFQIPIVPDAIPGMGALGGVYTALQAARHDVVVVLACDLPFVSRELLERLIVELLEEDDIVMPRSARGLEPLCAVYRKRILGTIRARIDRGALQISDLGGELRVHELARDVVMAYDVDGRLFANVNTPHDYMRALAWVEGNSEPPQDRITD